MYLLSKTILKAFRILLKIQTVFVSAGGLRPPKEKSASLRISTVRVWQLKFINSTSKRIIPYRRMSVKLYKRWKLTLFAPLSLLVKSICYPFFPKAHFCFFSALKASKTLRNCLYQKRTGFCARPFSKKLRINVTKSY